MTAETIHVALAVYDPKGTYSRHTGVVMASIFKNTDGPVRIHISRGLHPPWRLLFGEAIDGTCANDDWSAGRARV